MKKKRARFTPRAENVTLGGSQVSYLKIDTPAHVVSMGKKMAPARLPRMYEIQLFREEREKDKPEVSLR